MPLSFELADTASTPRHHVPIPVRDGGVVARDSTHTLAYKVLQLPIFSSVDLLASDLKPAGVFYLAGRMLEGKVPMPSLEVVQAVTKPSTDEDLARLRAQLAAKAIAAFDDGASERIEPCPPFDAPLATGVAYLSDVAARPA